MPFRFEPREQIALLRSAGRWVLLVTPMSVVVGSSCALFLWSLDKATALRWAYPWLLFTLPLCGVIVAAIYHYFGRNVEGGNNLLIDEIHEPSGRVPLRMAPMILVATVLTHLGGGSSGREGTAVQMGGSIASGFARLLRLRDEDLRVLLMAGVAAGFGGVFGTPLAGAIFALEVLAIGQLDYRALVPCLIASVVSDASCAAWGIQHTRITVLSTVIGEDAHVVGVDHSFHATLPAVGEYALLLGKVAVASVIFGLASLLFAELMHGTHRLFEYVVRAPLLRPIVGAVILIALSFVVGGDYLGLGASAPPNTPGGHEPVTILSAFHPGGAAPLSWWWKMLFTAITLGCGMRGGEVTPIFFVGATLGNVLAWLLGAPVELFAALGFVAVFAGATNTPLACTIMGVELFGPRHAVLLGLACFLAYFFSGHSGVYLSQRIGTPKGGKSGAHQSGASLRKEREGRPGFAAWLRKLRGR